MIRGSGEMLVVIGALLVAAPVGSSQANLRRVEAYYEQHGTGAILPAEFQVRPFARYDWACLGVGCVLIGTGVIGGKARRRPNHA